MERVVTVVPEAGLHARPAATFVQTANQYDAEVTIAPVAGDGDPVNAGNMLAVTGLGVAAGEDVRLVAEGEDAAAPLDAPEDVLTSEGDELS